MNQAQTDTLAMRGKALLVFGSWACCHFSRRGSCPAGTAGRPEAKIRLLIAVAAVIILWFGVQQAGYMFTWWPNSSGMLRELSVALSRAKCPCLIAENNVASYHLPQLPGVPVSTYSFSFQPKYARYQVSGLYAYKLAIQEGYFGVIQLDGAESTSIWTPLTRDLAGSREYTLLATIPASNQAHPFKIWVRR